MKTFYLTTPLYYPNARPHVGSAYTTIACDAIARYKKMCGYDVAFLTGTDEHGEKLERAAAAEGKPPSEFVAEKRELFRQLWKRLDIHYTHFVYTDQSDHVISVQRLLERARHAGYIDKRRYEGRYCVFDEMYISEGSEPVNCPNCGRPAELISEENYFFKLSEFQDRLLAHYDTHPEFVLPDFRMNEVKSFVRSGLRDISVSRKRIKWGIPWPGDPEHVFYVWYDALTGYLTGIGFAETDNGNAEFQEYWPASLHMIGKDILRFHAIYWPAFLMAANLPLPATIFAHGWIYYEEDKMSKSKGNVVYPEPIVELLGNDALRYYLLRDTPFGLDGSFSYEGLIQRFNSDLANGIGNLASRTLAMIERYCGGMIPDISEFNRRLADEWRSPEASAAVEKAAREICCAYDNFQFSRAAEEIWKIVAHYGDELLAQHQPWSHAQDLEQRWFVDGVLYAALEAVRTATVLAHPIIPESTRKIWSLLGCESYLGALENQRMDEFQWGQLKPGTRVGKPEPVFPRLDKAKTLAKLEELAEADRERSQTKAKGVTITVPSETQPSATQPMAGSEQSAIENRQSTMPMITIDDFAKVDLRAGEIVAAEPIPGATKLLKLQVDIGSEVRQVCAGIAEYYQPGQLIGRKVVLVANLQPRKLRGVESNGMVVAASVGDEGRPVLATFAEDVPNGTKLR